MIPNKSIDSVNIEFYASSNSIILDKSIVSG